MPPLADAWLPAWLLALTAVAAFTDARAGVIPHWLSLPSLLCAPLVHVMARGPEAAGASLLGALVCALVPLLLFGLRAIGGGDVKLLSAIGALAGASRGLEIQLASYCVLTCYALFLLAYRGQLLGTLARALEISIAPLLDRPLPAAETLLSLRLGPSIFVATAGVLASTWIGGSP